MELKRADERLVAMQEELAAASTQATETKLTLEKERAAFMEDKKILEDTIVDISSLGAVAQSDREAFESDLRQQMQRAEVSCDD